MTDNRQKVITIAHPELCSGELQLKQKKNNQNMLWVLIRTASVHNRVEPPLMLTSPVTATFLTSLGHFYSKMQSSDTSHPWDQLKLAVVDRWLL